MKRTFWEWVMGYKYILNTRTHEIHRIGHITKQCGVHYMSPKNKWKITEQQYIKFTNEHIQFNGCRHCFKVTDNG